MIAVILGIVMATAFWIWIIALVFKKSRNKNEEWNIQVNKLLVRKCEAMEKLCEIIRQGGRG